MLRMAVYTNEQAAKAKTVVRFAVCSNGGNAIVIEPHIFDVQ